MIWKTRSIDERIPLNSIFLEVHTIYSNAAAMIGGYNSVTRLMRRARLGKLTPIQQHLVEFDDAISQDRHEYLRKEIGPNQIVFFKGVSMRLTETKWYIFRHRHSSSQSSNA